MPEYCPCPVLLSCAIVFPDCTCFLHYSFPDCTSFAHPCTSTEYFVPKPTPYAEHTLSPPAALGSLVLVSDGVLETMQPATMCSLVADIARGATHIAIPQPAAPALAIGPVNTERVDQPHVEAPQTPARHSKGVALGPLHVETVTKAPGCSVGGLLADCGCCSTAGPDDVLMPDTPRPLTCPCGMAAGCVLLCTCAHGPKSVDGHERIRVFPPVLVHVLLCFAHCAHNDLQQSQAPLGVDSRVHSDIQYPVGTTF